jgi:hypothetical protein
LRRQKSTELPRQWIHDAIINGKKQRECCWTESIAVGSSGSIEETRTRLGSRDWEEEPKSYKLYVLREEPAPYNTDFDPKKGCLNLENSYHLEIQLAYSTA